MGVIYAIVAVLLVVTSLALVGLILIQRGKGGGLAAAFGGGGVEQAFGTRAATLAQKATATLGAIFLVLTILLGILHRERSGTMPSKPGGESTPAPASAPMTPSANPPAPTEAK